MCSRRVRRTPCPFKLYKRLLTTANTQVILSCVIHHCSTHYSPTGVPLPRFELAKRHGVVEKAVEQARQQGFQEASNAVPGDVGFPLVINRKTERHGFTGSKCRYYRSLTWAFSDSSIPFWCTEWLEDHVYHCLSTIYITLAYLRHEMNHVPPRFSTSSPRNRDRLASPTR